jgi:glycosyltransferase involved in cell wall biosynthesis
MSQNWPKTCLVIPALNEETTIGGVVRSIPREVVDEVIVVDNGSTDATAHTARQAGARVVTEPIRGYGRACWAGARYALSSGAGVVAFMDGDGSDCPEFMPDVVGPVARGEYDFVLGSRVRGRREPGSLNLSQLVAAKLAGWLIRLRYGVSYTDMSPFRAIRADALAGLGMREMTYGWNLEMQILVAARGLRVVEAPVGQRRRQGGTSKVSGQLPATLKAASRIAWTFFRLAIGPAGSRPKR